MKKPYNRTLYEVNEELFALDEKSDSLLLGLILSYLTNAATLGVLFYYIGQLP